MLLQRASLAKRFIAAARGVAASLTAVLSPGFLVVALLLAGAGCVVAGIHLMLGLPWALIAGGVALVLLAYLAARELTGG